MKIKTPNGREVNKNYQKYRIDWDKDSKSKVQFSTKQFLKTYWSNHVVYEEFPVAGTKMKIDFFNQTKKIVIEVDGRQHDEYVKHFHGNRYGFTRQIAKDLVKERFCDTNNITFIRITDQEIKNLSVEFFQEKFGVDIF